jgi:hypothetical protein
MRIQLIFLFLLSGQLFAASDKEMMELFRNYDSVMLKHKIELVDQVFTEKFLKNSGGKAEFIAKVKELPKDESKALGFPSFSWKKGTKDEIYFANLKEISHDKKGTAPDSGNRFIIIRENGKLKIDGTMSDAE